MNTAQASLPTAITSGATIALILQQCLNYWVPETLHWSAVVGANNPGAAGELRNALWMIGLLAPLTLLIPLYIGWGRLVLVASFVCIHGALALFGQPPLLHAMAIATWVVYLPQFFWEDLTQRIGSPERRGLALYYDADCGFCKKVVHVLRTLLILPGTPLSTAQSDPSICQDMEAYNSWVVVDWQQNRHFKFEAIAYICSLSPVFWAIAPVLRWQPVMAIGTRFYEAIANNRKKAGLLTKFLTFQARPVSPSRLENWVICLGVTAYLAVHLPILTQEIYDFAKAYI